MNIPELLKSTNVDDRKKAIKALAKMNNPDAEKYLSRIYKTDDNEEVRELAKKALQFRRKKTTDETEAVAEDKTPAPAKSESTPQRHVVSEENQILAKRYFDQAMDLHVVGKDQRATRLIRDAFVTDPNLRDDEYVLRAAGSITGLEDPGEIQQFAVTGAIPGKAKTKHDDRLQDHVAIARLLGDLGMFWVVMSVVVVLGLLFINRYLLGVDLESGQLVEGSVTFGIAQTLGASTPLGAIGIGLLVSLVLLFVLLLYYVLVHFFATYFLNGEGSYEGLIHRTVVFMTIASAVMIVLTLAGVYAESFNAYSVPPIDDPTLLNLLTIGEVLVALTSTSLMANFVGNNYRFSMGKGAASLIVGGVLMYMVFLLATRL